MNEAPVPAEAVVNPPKEAAAEAPSKPTEPSPSEKMAVALTKTIAALSVPGPDGDLNQALNDLADARLAITDKPHQELVIEETPPTSQSEEVIDATIMDEPNATNPSAKKPKDIVDAEVIDDVTNEPEQQNLSPQEVTVDPTLNKTPDAELRQLLNTSTDPTLRDNILSVLRNRYPPIETEDGLDSSAFIEAAIGRETIYKLLDKMGIVVPDGQEINLRSLSPEDVQKLLDLTNPILLQITSSDQKPEPEPEPPEEATDEDEKTDYDTRLNNAIINPTTLIEQANQGDETAKRILVEIAQMRSEVINEVKNMPLQSANPDNQIQITIQQLQDLDTAEIRRRLDNGEFKTPVQEIVAETIINTRAYTNNAESYATTVRSQASWRLAQGPDVKLPHDTIQKTIGELQKLDNTELQAQMTKDSPEGQIAQAILEDRIVKEYNGEEIETPEAAEKRDAYGDMIVDALTKPYSTSKKAQEGDLLAQQVLTELKAIREAVRNNTTPDPQIEATRERLEALPPDELDKILNTPDISNLQDYIVAQEVFNSRRDLPDWFNRDAIPFLDDKEANPLESPTTATRLYNEVSSPTSDQPVTQPEDYSDYYTGPELFDDYENFTDTTAVEQELENTKTTPESKEKKEKIRLLNLLWWTLKATALGAGLAIAGTAGASVGAIGPKK